MRIRIEGLPAVHQPVKDVVVLYKPADRVIQSLDGPKTLCKIGHTAGIIVEATDPLTGAKEKYASCHD